VPSHNALALLLEQITRHSAPSEWIEQMKFVDAPHER
jgi:hypothetical protein